MLDENYIIILKANASNPQQVKGQVYLKIKHKLVADSDIDKKDPRVVVLAVLDNNQPHGYIERRMVFEDWRKANEVKDYHMDQVKVQQIQMEKTVVEEFLKECDLESN